MFEYDRGQLICMLCGEVAARAPHFDRRVGLDNQAAFECRNCEQLAYVLAGHPILPPPDRPPDRHIA